VRTDATSGRARRRPDTKELMSQAPFWRPGSGLITGGACALVGVAAGTARELSVDSATVWLCAGSVICAVITASVAIVQTIATRPPEIRRAAALQWLARKAATQGERQAAMTLLILDKAIARNQITDINAIRQALPAESQRRECSELHQQKPRDPMLGTTHGNPG